jgi:membrane-bound lytic murein transglycosylase A
VRTCAAQRASGAEQRNWMLTRLQPYGSSRRGAPGGQLTSYYEPVLRASRQPAVIHRATKLPPRPVWAAASPGIPAEIDTCPTPGCTGRP